MKIHIYALIDPRTDEPYYVGRTRHPRNRMGKHLNQSEGAAGSRRKEQPHLILTEAIVLSGQRPVMETLETVEGEAWRDAEDMWIQYFRSVGCKILNVKPGGQGNPDRVFPKNWRPYVVEHIKEFLPNTRTAETVAQLAGLIGG